MNALGLDEVTYPGARPGPAITGEAVALLAFTLLFAAGTAMLGLIGLSPMKVMVFILTR